MVQWKTTDNRWIATVMKSKLYDFERLGLATSHRLLSSAGRSGGTDRLETTLLDTRCFTDPETVEAEDEDVFFFFF